MIMAGGGGTRLWPLSRRARPKQLLCLLSEQTFLQACAARVEPLCGPARTIVVTTVEQAPEVRRSLPALPHGNVIAEPVGRNTAPCIGLAALELVRRDPDAILAVLPADHHVADDAAFRRVVERAARAAQDKVVTVGIRPDRPEPGYGYIAVGDEVETGLFRALGFVEKPDAARARVLVDGGRHLWNSGMFFFRADRILREIARHLPALAATLNELGRALDVGDVDQAATRVWPAVQAISIDHGVMEKVDEFFVVPGEFGWSDVGSWTALGDLLPKDGEGNAFKGDVVAVDSRGNVAVASGKTIALLGVDDLVVVTTEDAVLVCPKGRAQDVREIVAALEKRARKDLL